MRQEEVQLPHAGGNLTINSSLLKVAEFMEGGGKSNEFDIAKHAKQAAVFAFRVKKITELIRSRRGRRHLLPEVEAPIPWGLRARRELS